MRVNQRWWFWACPDCCGDFIESSDTEHIRCVRCGRTFDQWSVKFPARTIAQTMMYPDAFYEHPQFVDDPS